MNFEQQIEQHAGWRRAMEGHLQSVHHLLRTHDLWAPGIAQRLVRLSELLRQERLVVAFVAEFSRGKSELINALFFAHYGRRILPAAAGRTTMCPVELACETGQAPSLRLLPVETRKLPQSLQQWREDASAWLTLPLDPQDGESLARTLQRVAEVQHVTVDEARVLGFWNDEQPGDNPPLNADNRVEVPRWRHALVQLDHPLLRQGLVVLDTPGLNAVGVEPELTIGLLPQASAVLFVLEADAGVSRSDLELWRRHLGGEGEAPDHVLVVLNKIDTLEDSLSGPQEAARQVALQRDSVARTLGLPIERVLAVSALQGLTAKVRGDADLLHKSRLSELETALAQGLMGRKRSILLTHWRRDLAALFLEAAQLIHARQRDLIDHLLELQGLEGKNARLLQQMRSRLGREQAEFDACSSRLQDTRAQQQAGLRELVGLLGSGHVRLVTADLSQALAEPGIRWDIKAVYTRTFEQLRQDLARAGQRLQDIHGQLSERFRALNQEQGMSLLALPPPDLGPFREQIDLTERSHAQYLGWGALIKRLQAGFGLRLAHTLNSRLLALFESCLTEIDQWHRGSLEQLDLQLRDRRHHYARRMEAMVKVQEAAGQLDERVSELRAQHQQLEAVADELNALNRACLPPVLRAETVAAEPPRSVVA